MLRLEMQYVTIGMGLICEIVRKIACRIGHDGRLFSSLHVPTLLLRE